MISIKGNKCNELIERKYKHFFQVNINIYIFFYYLDYYRKKNFLFNC